MSKVLNPIINFISWLVSVLPMWMQYMLANGFYYIAFYVLGYRKKVVQNNLRNAFPEKSETEIQRITKKFYRHFADLFIETNAIRSFSAEEIQKRYRVTNREVLDELYDKGKSITLVMGHYGNWEFFCGLPFYAKHKIVAIYKPLKDKFFDSFMNKTRSKFGVQPVAMAHIYRELVNYNNQKIPTATMFIADQSPHKQQIRFWADFLNQPTPVFLGTEKIARKLDQAIVFCQMRKVKRGYYEVYIEKLFDDLSNVNDSEITKRHMLALENIIKEQPEYWLWSHRRWKHKPPTN